MRQITVHQINDNLVLSLHKLPGFYKLGTCCVLDEAGETSAKVDLWYTGDFFRLKSSDEAWLLQYRQICHVAIHLSTNYAIKNTLGTMVRRFNPSNRVHHLMDAVKHEGSRCE